MSTDYLCNILEKHLHNRLLLYISAAVLLLCVMIYYIIKKKTIVNEYCILGGLLLIVLVILFCVNVIPVINDIKQQDFVTVETDYYYRYPNGSSTHNWFDTGHVVVELDDSNERQHLYLPAGYSVKDYFPMGKYTGTIVYARRSRIILYFEPQSRIT